MVAHDTTGALNALGDTLEACLQDVPIRTKVVAHHGIRRDASVIVAIAQVHLELDLRLV